MNNAELLDFVKSMPDRWVQDAIFKADNRIKQATKIMCSVSGGSDSDIMLDLLHRLDDEKKITYVWFDTGLEYDATKEHLKYLECKYDISIEKVKAKIPIPLSIQRYGVPFLSKQVSEFIERLQRHGFQWEDEPLETLLQRYPKCRAALRWWTNDWGEGNKFSISNTPHLKEFLIQNPPPFAISNKCCNYAKKQPAKDYTSQNGFDLNCVGVRKWEGGARGYSYTSCFSPETVKAVAQYRPLFWFTKESKALYEACARVTHSDCYTVWGLTRTGCAACPFGRNYERELECIRKYEPRLYTAVIKLFGVSYEYTKKFRDFQKEMRDGEGEAWMP